MLAPQDYNPQHQLEPLTNLGHISKPELQQIYPRCLYAYSETQKNDYAAAAAVEIAAIASAETTFHNAIASAEETLTNAQAAATKAFVIAEADAAHNWTVSVSPAWQAQQEALAAIAQDWRTPAASSKIKPVEVHTQPVARNTVGPSIKNSSMARSSRSPAKSSAWRLELVYCFSTEARRADTTTAC
jgi:hypothetical protein